MSKTIAIIGGGAAGFFAAANFSDAFCEKNEVHIFEKTTQLLSKVKISGGGRCNVTHACYNNNELVQYYPRGNKELTGMFSRFAVADTVSWFSKKGIALKTESDGRMFPLSDSSMDIVNCLLSTVRNKKINVVTGKTLLALHPENNKYRLRFNDGELLADVVLITAGGMQNSANAELFANLNITVVPPVPSLFTFNIPDKTLHSLMGVSVNNVLLSVDGLKYKTQGTLLITHWGLSGPAVIKLSSLAAKELATGNYQFTVKINWVPDYKNKEALQQYLSEYKKNNASRKISTHPFTGISSRLFEYFLNKTNVNSALNWGDLSNAVLIKLSTVLTEDQYLVKGKTTFKEEFVTCGGVDLKEVDQKTMESKKHKGIYFAGEVLNIDGLTGGFNFQAAWTGAYIAATAIQNS